MSAAPTEPPGPEPSGERRPRRLLATIPVAVLVIVLGFVHVPYFVITPGGTEPVQPLIKVSDHTSYPSKGPLLLVDVYLGPANAYTAVWGWLSPSEAVVPQSDYLAPGQTQQDLTTQGYSQMDQSKVDATYVALHAEVGYPTDHGVGALVESTQPGSPAAGRLFSGDVITAVDGYPVTTVTQADARLQAAGTGRPIVLAVHDEEGGHAHTVTVTPQRGVVVVQTFSGLPADGRLFAGDRIVAVNGRPITTVSGLADLIRTSAVGHPLRLSVVHEGRTRTVTLSPTRTKGIPYPVIGVELSGGFGAELIPNFPFPVAISSGDIGGPSAGLMWTLGLIDVLTPGDLTGGHAIAGTGEIALNGDVLPIGGIQQKVVAAERAGATVFFAPASQANEAAAVAHGIVVVPVHTYRDALAYLQAHE